MSAFKEFLAKELSIENYIFYLAVEDYRKHKKEACKKLKPTDAALRAEMKPIAVKIFNTFINKNNIHSSNVNLPEDVDERITRRLRTHFDQGQDQEQGSSDKTIFDEAQEAIFKLMESDSWQRFQKSDSYSH